MQILDHQSTFLGTCGISRKNTSGLSKGGGSIQMVETIYSDENMEFPWYGRMLPTIHKTFQTKLHC